MTLTPTELLTLAGLLRFVMRFDDLDPVERAAALDEAGRELDLRASDVRMVDAERAGFRDAAMVVRVVATEPDDWLERAKGAIRQHHEPRRPLENPRQSHREVRVSMLRAVEILSRRGGLARPERLFLGWLGTEWGVPPVVGDDDVL